MLELILLVLSFILGSIPFGFLTGYFVKKIDIRKFGSGNIGATNVFRIVGKGWGIAVFILDILKGLLAPVLVKSVLPNAVNSIFILSAILAVCGHNWTPFLRFKGGKGVATSLGAICGLSFVFPFIGIIILLSLILWIGIFLICRYVSVASMVAGIFFFILSLVFPLPLEMRAFAFLLAVLIVLRHKDNIKKLLTKQEYRF